jgi:hypothetical protein
MSGHLAAIGFRGDDWQPQVMEASSQAAPAGRSDGIEHYMWSDPSGARVLYHAKGSELLCITPGFRPRKPSVWEVESSAPLVDADCLHCSGADFDIPGSRATIQLELFALWRQYLSQKRRFPMEVCGFAHRAVRCRESEIEKLAGIKLAPSAFVPSGMFGTSTNVTQRATAVLTGKLEAVETLRNGHTKADFLHLRVSTLPGPLDLVSEVETFQGDGDILFAEVWLVGRPQERKD